MSKFYDRPFRGPLCLCLSVLVWLLILARYPEALRSDNIVEHVDSGILEKSNAEKQERNVTLVIASQAADDTSWVHNEFVDWEKIIYVTDDANAEFSVLANKGRENMVYLTYIIDNYETLAPITIFQHANRYQWHNDDPLYDGKRMLSRLNLPYVEQAGYVNLRCVWTLGCPVEIRPLVEKDYAIPFGYAQTNSVRAGSYYTQMWDALFPDEQIPETVGVPCCGQFAVTAETIRGRSKSDYERYRQWLLHSHLSDDLNGRDLEYAWHIIFGRDAVHCPNAKACYCNVYGLCDLECETEGVCRSQYTLPPYSKMPKGWPDYDFGGNWQDASAM